MEKCKWNTRFVLSNHLSRDHSPSFFRMLRIVDPRKNRNFLGLHSPHPRFLAQSLTKTKTPSSFRILPGQNEIPRAVKLKIPSGFFIFKRKVSPLLANCHGSFDTLCPFSFSLFRFSLICTLVALKRDQGH